MENANEAHDSNNRFLIEHTRCSDKIKEVVINGDINTQYRSTQHRDGAIVLSMLKTGHTHQEIYDIFSNVSYKISLPFLLEGNKYLDKLIREKETFLQEEDENPLTIQYNRYYKTVNKKTIPISNFIMKLSKLYIQNDGSYLREIYLVSPNGTHSQPFFLDPVSMATLSRFDQLIYSKGRYRFKGNLDDLKHTFQHLDREEMVKSIYQPNYTGYINTHNLWLLGDVAIKETGDIFFADNEKIFWLDDKTGIKPIELINEGHEQPLPIPFQDLTKKSIRECFETLISNLKRNLGGHQGTLAISWLKACVYMNEIVSQLGFFPLLFVCGKYQSGKNVFCNWLMAFFAKQKNSQYVIADTTSTAMTRLLAYSSCLPVWFDEYRNERKVNEKEIVLRSIYNRSGTGKGIPSNTVQIKSVLVRGGAMLSGETLPIDDALQSRCIPIRLNRKNRDATIFPLIEADCDKFQNITISWIQEKTPESVRILIQSIRTIKNELLSVHNIKNTRLAECYAICIAVYRTFYFQDNFEECILSEIRKEEMERSIDDQLNEFWANFVLLILTDNLFENLRKFYVFDMENKLLHLDFKKIYTLWEEQYRRRKGREPFPYKTLLSYLKEEAYYVHPTTKDGRIWISGTQTRSGITIKGDDENTPVEIKDLFESNLAALNEIERRLANN